MTPDVSYMQEEPKSLQDGDLFSKGRGNQNTPFETGPGSREGVILSGALHSLPQLSCASWKNSYDCMVD